LIKAQNNIRLPIVVEPIEAQHNIELPIVVEPVEAKSITDLTTVEKITLIYPLETFWRSEMLKILVVGRLNTLWG
jgi:hypothetical protein